ncbi:olfactory receptor 51I2-like [Dromiciops gliroides]|uniref:olfactory receptor 51I2-like n=1 Tax=Dromiciops gliroides TaxID=33562 RepID=UPI001CC78CAE|nr:olfactory receptor 51I2-like [Dromiciops gliroides]
MFLPKSHDNNSFQPSASLLIGIPGLEVVHGWVSIPFCFMYTMALIGNHLILGAMRTPSLHQSMYYFLYMLSLTDLGFVLCTLPTTLSVLWFNYNHITFDTCLVQMIFLHTFSVILSSVLLAISFDRFVAISNPLRYASVLTNSVIGRIGMAIVTHATVSLFPVPFLLKRLNFCPEKVQLSHSFCFHADKVKMACADITVIILYGLYVVLSTGFVDSFLIALSYGLMLYTVMGLASPREWVWALNTCVSHSLAFLIFCVPVIGVSIVHRFRRLAPPIAHALVAYVYLFLLLCSTLSSILSNPSISRRH